MTPLSIGSISFFYILQFLPISLSISLSLSLSLAASNFLHERKKAVSFSLMIGHSLCLSHTHTQNWTKIGPVSYECVPPFPSHNLCFENIEKTILHPLRYNSPGQLIPSYVAVIEGNYGSSLITIIITLLPGSNLKVMIHNFGLTPLLMVAIGSINGQRGYCKTSKCYRWNSWVAIHVTHVSTVCCFIDYLQCKSWKLNFLTLRTFELFGRRRL